MHVPHAKHRVIFKKTPRIPDGVKIREGIEILYGMYKAKGGLIRTAQEVEMKRLRDIGISGDFTLYPKNELINMEKSLINANIENIEIKNKIEEFYENTDIQTPRRIILIILRGLYFSSIFRT
ncbi:unnamed protein product, partial [marine sediment metagenome]